MNFHPSITAINQPIPEAEQKFLDYFRSSFDVAEYVQKKVDILCEYFVHHGLTGAVVAISGGIDSAVVAGLLAKVRAKINTQVIGITLPALDNSGVSGQSSSMARANEVLTKYGIRYGSSVMNMTPLHAALDEAMQSNFGLQTDNWAKGQAVPYLRTALLYSITAMLSSNGIRSVLVGTTNRDEGLYLGYIGKASDGMVDIQPISDLHKSQVREVAKYLGVPQSIIDVVPTGDMFDGRTDEEVFGASYDMVELAMYVMHHVRGMNAYDSYRAHFGDDAALCEQMNSIDALHGYNRHKYLGASPAVHFDLSELNIKNGWKTNNWSMV
jgi:NAD+ synthase (glutamine-hydrolysing)